MTPTTISKSLYISKATTYKHIAHIYEKLHVSSLQELLVRLLQHENSY
jgi:DNA-binding CsgD family transcriptional regulator